MSRQGNISASRMLVTGPYRRDPADAVRLVGTVAAILSIAAGVIHISAAGDHTNLPVMFAGFMVVAILQIALGALLLWQRPSRLLLAAGLALMVSSLGLWLLSRTAGIPFLPNGHQEPIGFKDGVTKLLELASIPALLLLWSRDLAAVSLPSPRLASQILSAVGAATFALFVPALLLNGGEHHSHAEAVALGIHEADHASGHVPAHADAAAHDGRGEEGHDTTHEHASGADHSEHSSGGHSHSGTEFASAPLALGHHHAGGGSGGAPPRHHAGGDHGDHRQHQHHKGHHKNDRHKGHDRGGGHGHGGHGDHGGDGSGSDQAISVSYEPTLSVCISAADVCVP